MAHPARWLFIHCIQIKLEFKNVGFRGEGKKLSPLGARTRTNNKHNTHYDAESRNQTTVPSLLPTISWALPIPVLATDIATLRANKLQKSKWIKTHDSECTNVNPLKEWKNKTEINFFGSPLGGYLIELFVM